MLPLTSRCGLDCLIQVANRSEVLISFSSPLSSRIEINRLPELRNHLRSAMQNALLTPENHNTAYQLACYLGTTGFRDRCLYGDILSPFGEQGVTFPQAVDLAFDEFREHGLLPDVGYFGRRRQRRSWVSFVSFLVWSIIYSDA